MPLRWKWVLAVSLASLLFFSSEGVRSSRQKKRVLGELQKKLEGLRQTNKNLKSEIRQLQTDPIAIERIARKELGLVQPGEIEYLFVVRHSSS